jgi:hypothetical protein
MKVIYEEQVMAHIQNHTKLDFKTWKLHHFPHIHREIAAEKTRFQTAKVQKISTLFRKFELRFWGYLWRTSDGSPPELHKTRIRNLKISPFFLISSEK